MALKENNAFTHNYAKLCNTLTDIENLLQYFVQEKIIKPEDQDDINILPKTQEKVKKLLKHVAGPLKAGDSKGFYTMLKIMENHGVQATKDLAEALKTELSADISLSQENVPAISYKPTNRLSAQFSSLVRTVENVLDKSSKNLETCKRFCLDLTISDNYDVLLFNDEQLKKIKGCVSFRELFELLRQHWSWKEYCILEHIINESESQDAKDELEKYEKMMSSYFGLQILADKFSPSELPNEYIKMTIIIEKPYKELTPQNFIEVRDFIFKQMDVKPYIAHPFIKFLFSSLHLEWYVLQQAVPHMIEMSYENIERLKEYSIVYIKIGEEIIVDENATHKVNSDHEVHGLKFVFVELLPYELICSLCKLPCNNPQISLCCKNNFCEGHLEAVSGISTQNQCPMCYSEKFEAFPNTQADERIQALMVYCPNKEAGCSWVGKLSEVNEHCNSDHIGCPFQEINCPNDCGISVQRKYLEDHLVADCPCYCQYCKATGDKMLIANHHKEKCQKFTVQCPNGCGVTMLREKISEHCKVCPLEQIQCEYYSLGCRVTMLRRDKEEHNKNNVVLHIDLMKKNISGISAAKIYGFLFCVIVVFLIIYYSHVGLKYYEMENSLKHIVEQCHETEVHHHEMKIKYHIMELKYHEMENSLKQIEGQCHETAVHHHEMEFKYHEMENRLNQELRELKSENGKLKNNISDKQHILKTITTKLKTLENRINDYATSEELKKFENFIEIMHDNVIKAADGQTIEVNKLKTNFNKLESTMDKNYKNLSVAIDRNFKQMQNLTVAIDRNSRLMISKTWIIHLSILRLLALHDNQVVPVVLVISNYSEWVKDEETWHSPLFLDARNGNKFCLSVKPIETDLFVTLHLATYSRKRELRNGIFVIEMLNLINDSNHSMDKIHFNNAATSVSKATSDTKFFENKIVGNLNYSIPRYKDNVTYILRDELFLRVSFYSDA